MSYNNPITETVNNINIASVRKQIYEKTGSVPYYATINTSEYVINDMDHFPYTRFFRGLYKSPDPVVLEREAGWRPVNNLCYRANNYIKEDPYPNHCFESSCSVVYPCYPEKLQKISDRDALNVQVNKECTIQYR